jgi:hypothetical protein
MNYRIIKTGFFRYKVEKHYLMLGWRTFKKEFFTVRGARRFINKLKKNNGINIAWEELWTDGRTVSSG